MHGQLARRDHWKSRAVLEERERWNRLGTIIVRDFGRSSPEERKVPGDRTCGEQVVDEHLLQVAQTPVPRHPRG